MKVLKSITLFVLFLLMGISSLTAQELTAYAGFWKPHFYEDNHEISSKQFKEKLMSDKEASIHWKSYTKRRKATLIGAGIGIGCIAWASYNIEKEKNITLPVIGAIGGLALELGAGISSLKKYRLALLTYNENVDTRSTSISKPSFKLAPTFNGAGLVMTF